jgi:DNA ligase-1
MNEVYPIIKQVMDASGTLAKSSILSKYSENVKLKRVLQFVYDPYNRCCIGENKLAKALSRTDANGITDPLLVIDYLSKHNTGSDDATNYAAGFVHSVNKAYGDNTMTAMAMAIVMQDLKMGMAVKGLNSVFGKSFIPVTGCMLGTLYGDVNNVEWPCIVTEKLDGIRRVLIKHHGICRMFSRSGHEDAGCVDILYEAAEYLPDNMVYDGELLAIGTFKDNIAWRQATNSIANSDGIKHGLTLNVFDMLPVEEFYEGRSKMNAFNRKMLLAATFGDEDGLALLTKDWTRVLAGYYIYNELSFIKPVPILGVAASLAQVTPIVDSIWRQHGEGVMLNTYSGYYEIKKSKQLLKVKFSEDKVLKIVGFTEGTGKYEGSLGAVLVDYKGIKVGVGSGFTDSQRLHIWQLKYAYIGKMIEIETFGESTNALGGISLNCPIFKRFVGQEE